MRLANVEGRATILTDEGGVDVATVSVGAFGPDLRSVYDDWDEFRAFAAAQDHLGGPPVDETRLGPPSPQPRQVFGIGLNYRAHAEETGATVPSIPATFTKFPSCLTGPFGEVVLSSDTVDWEVELVVVIGRTAHRVPRDEGWDVVAGLTVGQDLSDRTVQIAAGAQFSLGKSYPGFGPTGPWLVTPDQLADPDDLALRCSVDGEIVQDARTSDMVHDVPGLVAELSAVVTLYPGDVVFTGTPSGVGMGRRPPRFLRPGQTLETTIAGIGTMRHTLVAPVT